MISDDYNEVIRTERMTVTSGNIKELASSLTNIRCLIFYDEDKMSKDISDGFGKDLSMICDDVDIVEGDRVFRTIDGAEVEYRVVAKKGCYDFIGDDSHLELKIRAFQS